MIDIEIQISISERSSGWAINYTILWYLNQIYRQLQIWPGSQWVPQLRNPWRGDLCSHRGRRPQLCHQVNRVGSSTNFEVFVGFSWMSLCRYNVKGFVEELPALPKARKAHACTSLPKQVTKRFKLAPHQYASSPGFIYSYYRLLQVTITLSIQLFSRALLWRAERTVLLLDFIRRPWSLGCFHMYFHRQNMQNKYKICKICKTRKLRKICKILKILKICKIHKI